VGQQNRYYIEFESTERHARLMAAAKLQGTYSTEHDDWFQPEDILAQMEAGDDLPGARAQARKVLPRALYGQARICKRTLDPETGLYDSEVVENIE
jgi:hypothetical protein